MEIWDALGVDGGAPGVAEGAGEVETGQGVVEAGLRRSVTLYTHTYCYVKIYKNIVLIKKPV